MDPEREHKAKPDPHWSVQPLRRLEADVDPTPPTWKQRAEVAERKLAKAVEALRRARAIGGRAYRGMGSETKRELRQRGNAMMAVLNDALKEIES